jgi:hypothetical protein
VIIASHKSAVYIRIVDNLPILRSGLIVLLANTY